MYLFIEMSPSPPPGHFPFVLEFILYSFFFFELGSYEVQSGLETKCLRMALNF